MASRVDRLTKRKKKASDKGKEKKAADINKKIGRSMARQENRGKRKAGEETRLEQRQKKIYGKAQHSFKKGNKKKGMRLLGRTSKQQDKMKKRSKGETGIYPIISGGGLTGGTTYGRSK